MRTSLSSSKALLFVLIDKSASSSAHPSADGFPSLNDRYFLRIFPTSNQVSALSRYSISKSPSRRGDLRRYMWCLYRQCERIAVETNRKSRAILRICSPLTEKIASFRKAAEINVRNLPREVPDYLIYKREVFRFQPLKIVISIETCRFVIFGITKGCDQIRNRSPLLRIVHRVLMRNPELAFFHDAQKCLGATVMEDHLSHG
jgi:hypothetical protein